MTSLELFEILTDDEEKKANEKELRDIWTKFGKAADMACKAINLGYKDKHVWNFLGDVLGTFTAHGAIISPLKVYI